MLLGAGVVAGFLAAAEGRRISTDWDGYREERRAEVAELVNVEFNDLMAEGNRMVARVAGLADSGLPPHDLQDSLGTVLDGTDMAAVAAFGPDRRLVAWAGSHHGRFPPGVVSGSGTYAYTGTPLFSYLYFAEAVGAADGMVVAAALMKSDLPAPFASGLGDFASRIADQSGSHIRIMRGGGRGGASVLDDDGPVGSLLNVTVASLDASIERSRLRVTGVTTVAALAMLAWLVLSLSGASHRIAYAVGGLLAAAVLVPLEGILTSLDLNALAGPRFEWPLPLALGRVLLISVATAPIVLLGAFRWRPELGAWFLPVVVAAGFPLVLSATGEAAPLEVLGAADLGWICFQLATTLIVTLVVGAALWSRNPEGPEASTGWTAAGLLLAAALSVAVAAAVRVGPHISPALGIMWTAPAALIGRGVGSAHRFTYTRWFCAFWLAATAVLPWSWAMRTQARMVVAETQLGELGIAPEPEVGDLADRFAQRVDSLHEAGAGAAEMMYHGWVSSGLAAHGSPIFLTLWSAEGDAQQELRLGVKGDLPAAVGRMWPEIRAAATGEHHMLNEIDVRHLIVVPLSDGHVVTGAITPRRTIAEPSGVGPLFAAVEEGGNQEFLTLTPIPEGSAESYPVEVEWRRNAEGWMGVSSAPYPDGRYAVTYTISIPNLPVMFARGTLLLVLGLVVVSLLWLVSVSIRGRRLFVSIEWRELFGTFRARVTWTLFGFFILSNVVFGTLAYRTLSGASERTATALAERVVGQIAEAYREEGGSMELLARRVGADLLEYRGGELVGGSTDELIELGLYESWVDPEIYAALASGQQRAASKAANLGDWRYVLAYRRLPDGDIVASPVPLRAGAAALRRRDVADLLGVAIVLGPIVALGLALIVGRALARPIQTLKVASERVGRGNLAVHLPRDRVDEFGAVFTAFNRMVLRLGDARRELLRTTRRTQAIVAEVATGVIAVDKQGRVTVANPVADAILGTSLRTGVPIPKSGERGAELASWLNSRQRIGVGESDAVFRWGDRRIRARARRIVHEGYAGGVVVSLEDVTDELRSERILAWGEMAKQVAHEVKNPLTPIKLSVQHLRRAWDDSRGDFGDILKRNVTTVLGEIDRLASIARSFSRLASPAAEDKGPLEAVDVATVVQEVLNLYEGGAHASVQLDGELGGDLPLVQCRPDELMQVLLNLVENSRVAMPEGGVISILAIASEDGSGDVVVTVADDGKGIPADLLPRIFEPRFSTRSKGAGLGLAIVKRLVDSWGGIVKVESTVAKGTTVSVRLRMWST